MRSCVSPDHRQDDEASHQHPQAAHELAASHRLMQRIERINGRNVLPTDFAACNAYGGGIEKRARFE